MSDAPFYPYGRQSIDASDVEAVARAVQDDYLTTGPAVDAFEGSVATFGGAAEGVAVNSGTAALHAAYLAAGVGPGTEVITSPMTFASTANVALHLGAEVRFADVDPATGLLDPAAAEALITDRTRLIVPVDLAGAPADYPAFDRLRRDGLGVVGDASHSLGATLHGRPIGQLADAVTVSLHPVKPLTTGEGGVVLTNDAAWASRMREYRSHGIRREAGHALEEEGPWAYSMVELGLNYRLTDLQCALGLSQLARLEGFLARRRAIAARYDEALADCPGVRTPVVPEGAVSGWHLYVLRVEDPSRRRAFFERLRELRIGVQVHYLPVYWHPFYEGLGFRRGLCPKAEDYYSRILSIPMYPGLEDADVDEVVARVRRAAADVL